ncbi:AI-2E family transporter [Glycomyces sp. L485]|uniref:AI-2E family transporter n=1 Tax=Glycomyces sp. L485 TaxID=2909235 RepID=UPI001F4BB270|nr:AI-2E family transporter [Glycomyces sp. L485]MCH7232305.1 AI-2E family transporter [Glycomyces sp. L485]
MTGKASKLPTRRSLSQTPPVQAGLFLGVGLAFAAVLVWAVIELKTLIIVLVVAGFLAVGLNRPVRAMTRRGLPRWLALVVLVLGLVLVFCGGFALIIPAIVRQTTEFAAAAPTYYDQVMASGFAQRFGGESRVLERLQGLTTAENLSTAAGGLLGGAVSVATVVGWTLTALILSLFILVAHDRIRDSALRFVVASKRARAGEILDRILLQAGAYLMGALTIAIAAGGAAWIFMVIAGIPYAAILAFIVALTDLIPQVGATIGAAIVTLVALTVSPMTAVAAVIFFVVYQQLENWIIYPTIMGSAVKVSNLAALVSVLIGATLFGVVGVILAVPSYAAIRLVVQELVHPRLDAH